MSACGISVPVTPYDTAILIIIEVQFQVFQRFSGSQLVLKTVGSCFVALSYYGNGSNFFFCLFLLVHSKHSKYAYKTCVGD